MALRPFSRNSKEPAVKETAQTALDESTEVEQFFSNGSKAEDTSSADARSVESAARPVPSVPSDAPPPPAPVQEHGVAGWYPDEADPGLMRYWDGFHFTGQIMHVHSRVDDAPAAPPAEVPQVEPAETVEAVTGSPDNEAATGSPDNEAVTEVADNEAVTEVAEERRGAFAFRATDRPAPASPAFVPLLQPSPAAEPAANDGGPELSDGPVEAAPSVVPTIEASSPNSIRTKHLRVGDNGANATSARAAGTSADEVEGDDHDRDNEGELVVTVFKGDENVSTNGAAPQVTTSPVARIKALAEGVDGVDDWADQTDKAVARARSLGTPEAWEEAAEAAAVVSEMARTMRAAAAATQTATQLDGVAKAAADKARLAAESAEEAKQSAQQATESARKAEATAKAAEQAATEARAKAERTAEEAPKRAEEAKVSAQAAAEAGRKAHELEDIAASAGNVNTPAAWSEALKRTLEASGGAASQDAADQKVLVPGR
jgi:hypothetical protein